MPKVRTKIDIDISNTLSSFHSPSSRDRDQEMFTELFNHKQGEWKTNNGARGTFFFTKYNQFFNAPQFNVFMKKSYKISEASVLQYDS